MSGILAAPIAAQALDGRYFWLNTDPAVGCDPERFSEDAITISGAGEAGLQMDFIESRCMMSNPLPIRGMPEGTLYDAQCNGEGETWQERFLVYRTFEGLAVLSRGAARTYARCP